MRRRLAVFVVAVLLVAAAVAAVYWPMSYRRIHEFQGAGRSPSGEFACVVQLRAERGAFIADVYVPRVTTPALTAQIRAVAPYWRYETTPLPGPNIYPTYWGVGWQADKRTYGVGVGVPLWFAALLLGLPGTAWLIVGVRARRRLARRQREGGCPACGYDLRATPDRCPECGAATTTQSPQPAVAG